MLRVELISILADYLARPYLGRRQGELLASFQAAEKMHYAYLPNLAWMQLVGYESAVLGCYVSSQSGDDVSHKVEILSQTSMVLLFRQNRFVAAQLVESDAQLVALLHQHDFPLPPCA